MIKVSVLYPYKPESRFDHDYYRNSHIPLIAERLGAGLLFYTIDRGIAVGKPNEPPSFIAMVNLFSESVEAFQTAFARHADEIMRGLGDHRTADVGTRALRFLNQPLAGQSTLLVPKLKGTAE